MIIVKIINIIIQLGLTDRAIIKGFANIGVFVIIGDNIIIIIILA